MAAALAALLAVLSVVLAAHADDDVILRNHKTVHQKSYSDARFNFVHEYIIPSGQCNYNLRFLCPYGFDVRGVRVTVEDVHPAIMEIDNNLVDGRVKRGYPCVIETPVKVGIDCRPWKRPAPNVNEE